MIQQLTIDFSKVVHTRENNSGSEEILHSEYERLNEQCRRTLNILLSGKRLTVKDGMLYYEIGDVRRRVKDLIDYAGVKIEKAMLPGGRKEYYLSESEIKRLKAA